MDGHERKKLRLKGYDYSKPGAYFVTICTQQRKCILGTIVGADDHIGPCTQLSAIGNVVKKYTRTIPGVSQYVIMPNHVHMILRISAKDPLDGPIWQDALTDTSVEKIIRTWKILITKQIGQSIWQRSFYDHIIRNEAEFNDIARYMENNPAKWCEDRYYPGY